MNRKVKELLLAAVICIVASFVFAVNVSAGRSAGSDGQVDIRYLSAINDGVVTKSGREISITIPDTV